MKYNTIVVDNLFDNFEALENSFKKVPLMSFEEYPKTISNTATWPGKRSMPLFEVNPFLCQLVIKELQQKSQNRDLENRTWNINSVLHLRLKEDNEKDWIHTDPDDLTIIIFLGKTNLDSGIHIYNEQKEETEYIKYIQNRAVIFNSKSYHKAGASYGNNVEDGRLTMNCFINFQ
jgi:hypothetical protein